MRITTHQLAEQALEAGFAAIVKQFDLPREFPAAVLAEADQAIAAFRRDPLRGDQGPRRDATQIPLVTLDPPTSTDLDQAFYIERKGDLLVLHYALADVAAFVPLGGAIEREAWNRGVTIYGLANKIPLYPTSISQRAASLLPDGPRPAILVSVAIDVAGGLKLLEVERVLCASRAKLGYPTVNLADLPNLEDFANRMWIAEAQRGSKRFQFPEQEVITDTTAPGGVRLELRTPLYSEEVNSALSLAVNMAIAEQFKDARMGLFRTMDEPSPRAIERLRLEAHALQIDWQPGVPLHAMLRHLDPNQLIHKRFLLMVRRAGGRAGYAVFSEQDNPWHAAIGAAYVHATAPMRRLADRYVLELAYQIAKGETKHDSLRSTLEALPAAMASGGGRAKAVEQAVTDLIEAVSLQHRIGEVLRAEVVDSNSKIVQTLDSAIRSRAAKLPASVSDGEIVSVRIDEADPVQRRVVLTAVRDK
jgi:exoribonuclease R